MNFEKSKHSKAFMGKSFYIIIALCLIAIGAATWMSLSKPNDDTGELPDASSQESESAPSVPNTPDLPDEEILPSDESVDTEKTDEPYTPPLVEVSPEPPVAVNFTMPLNGNVAKEFSEDTLVYSNTYRDMRLHNGIDISGTVGDPIRACGSGTVTLILDDAKLGLYVEVDHGNGVIARYCGLSAVSVEEGDTVDAVTVLGKLGEVNEECLDAAHLHLEFTKDGHLVDPLSVIYPE